MQSQRSEITIPPFEFKKVIPDQVNCDKVNCDKVNCDQVIPDQVNCDQVIPDQVNLRDVNCEQCISVNNNVELSRPIKRVKKTPVRHYVTDVKKMCGIYGKYTGEIDASGHMHGHGSFVYTGGKRKQYIGKFANGYMAVSYTHLTLPTTPYV